MKSREGENFSEIFGRQINEQIDGGRCLDLDYELIRFFEGNLNNMEIFVG
jgi:hypothetical protein